MGTLGQKRLLFGEKSVALGCAVAVIGVSVGAVLRLACEFVVVGVVDVLEVATQVAALGESFLAELTLEGALAGMFSKVVAEVAGLLEHTATALIHTLKVQLNALSLGIAFLDNLMPRAGDAFESL
jgi:hypothetical protein